MRRYLSSILFLVVTLSVLSLMALKLDQFNADLAKAMFSVQSRTVASK